MLAPRAAMTFFMIMNRMRARQIPTEAERERENESLGNSKLPSRLLNVSTTEVIRY